MKAREAALRILMEVEEKGGKSHLALRTFRKEHTEMSEQDRRLVLRLVQGTLERRSQLDHRINQKARIPVTEMRPLIREILRMSAFQLFYLDRVPDRAVCDEAVRLTEQFGYRDLKGFVNGVLRAMARETAWPEETRSVSSGIPEWILKRWEEEYGDRAVEEWLRSLNKPAPLSFRRCITRCTERELMASLESQGARALPAPFPEGAYILHHRGRLEDLEAFRRGWIQVQDCSSMMVGALAGIRPGMRILDVCAAPGGKSLQAADLLRGSGEVIACDRSERKVREIQENISRFSFPNVRALVRDATQFVPAWEKSADLVLADLPCSGLGVMGRKPEIRERITPEGIRGRADFQKKILENVGKYVKPGGFLLYSTCTVTREENAENRRWVLDHLPFEAADFSEFLPEALAEERSAAEGFLQLIPGIHPCDGFYIAKFRRKVTAAEEETI